MTNERPGTRVPFDEEKLQLVREFLRREFRGCQHRDYFEFDTTAQVFLIETSRNVRHKLAIPKGIFEDADFILLLNRQLVATLKLAGSVRVTLTPQEPRALAAERKQFERFLKWRRATTRAGATLVRHSLVYGAAMLLLGIGCCALISSLAWEARDPRQRVSEWRLVSEERHPTPSDQPQAGVRPSHVSATVIEDARRQGRRAAVARRAASTERPAPRPSPTKRPQAGPIDALRRLAGYFPPEVQLGKAMVRWVKAQPPPDLEARLRVPEIPQSR